MRRVCGRVVADLLHRVRSDDIIGAASMLRVMSDRELINRKETPTHELGQRQTTAPISLMTS